MSALSKVLRNVQGGGLTFWCPGCDQAHGIMHGAGPGPRWTWNGDVEKPTFSPSVLVTGTEWLTDEEHARLMTGEHVTPTPSVCHSFVTDGRIQFLGDCTHALANQTVDLPEHWGTSAQP